MILLPATLGAAAQIVTPGRSPVKALTTGKRRCMMTAMEEAPKALAPMDFSTFIMSLATSAMVQLGEVPAPGQTSADASEGDQRDLAAAKQMIDILSVLEEKTRGNLDEAEDKLLKSLLYDLRVKFVDAQNAKHSSDGS